VSGLVVLEAARDGWANARAIWNQHAYAVTGVNDQGQVPTSSAWQSNATTPGLNNFRQAVATVAPAATTDLTARADGFVCDSGGAQLAAFLCNRGALPAPAGQILRFGTAGDPLCEPVTSTTLAPGGCERLTCAWTTPPSTVGQALAVTISADSGIFAECLEGNNATAVSDVYCVP
jgi:hypothetical protein